MIDQLALSIQNFSYDINTEYIVIIILKEFKAIDLAIIDSVTRLQIYTHTYSGM